MWFAHLLFLLLIIADASALIWRKDTFRTVSHRQLPLSAVRRHLPRASKSELRHIVFELQDGHLVSHHARLSLRNLVTDKFILSDDGTHEQVRIQPGHIFHSHNSSKSYALQGHGYTFAFDGESNSLIAAWGPALQLHPVHTHRHDGIFLNFATRKIQTTPSSDGVIGDRVANALKKAMGRNRSSKAIKASVKQQSCTRQLKFEIGVGYDSSFCALYGNSEKNTEDAISALNLQIYKVFRDATCVVPSIINFDGFCDSSISRLEEDAFARPSAFSTDCSGDNDNPDCARNSRLMLELSAREWARTVSSDAHRDAAFLFTGYGDDTSLAGATYRAAACSDELSFAWVEGPDPVVFAHEVGHMLGAPHDLTGFMTATVHEDEELTLSEKSTASINRFVQKDPRSWCLERNWNSFGNLQRRYKWNTPLFVVQDEKQNLNISDMTILPSFQAGFSPIILSLISERVDQNSFLSYTAIPNITCNAFGSCNASPVDLNRATRRISIPLNFDKGSFGFGIASANVQHESSRDVLISHIRAHGARHAAYYQVGYNFDDIDSAPQNWSREHQLRNFFPENVQCSSITTGHVRGDSSTDLLHVHVDRRKGKNIVQYRIGFDIGSDGSARGGWSEGIDVKGWYGRSTTAVSLFVKDLGLNGRPELIMYHVDNTPGIKIGSLRIGKDLNSTGHVTGGWTDFIRIPVFSRYPTYRSGAMTIADLGGFYPSVVSAQREAPLFGPDAWNLYVGTHVLTPSFLRTAKERPDVTELQDGCFECYRSHAANQCARDVGVCGARIDEVSVEDGPPSVTPDVINGEFDDETEEEEIAPDPTRPTQPHTQSIYCDGFHYLYSRNQGCDVFDRGTVLAKGVVIAFEKAMEEKDPGVGMNMSSTSLFEEPAGVSDGSRKPIVAETVIVGKKKSYLEVIKLAIKKLKNRPGFNSFIFPKAKKEIIFKHNKYFVKFIFNPNHFNEFKK